MRPLCRDPKNHNAMNLLKPQRILVASGDPHTSWIVLAQRNTVPKTTLRRLFIHPRVMITVVAASVIGFFLIPASLTLFWNIATKPSLSHAEPAALSEIVPATVGGAVLPQTIPTQPATATAPAQTATATAASRTIQQDRIVIPKIGVNMPVLKGENEQTLLKGAWLAPWGSTPDQGGNTTIFGHRFLRLYPNPETFHALDRLAVGDAFDIRWANKTYRYTVVDTRVVPPEDVSVMNPTLKPSVTLITCTPVFTTKYRLVVRGELVNISP